MGANKENIKVITIDVKKYLDDQLAKGQIKALPRSGKCMFCGNQLTTGEDHSVCNKCWTDTFACNVCGDESGDCKHRT